MMDQSLREEFSGLIRLESTPATRYAGFSIILALILVVVTCDLRPKNSAEISITATGKRI